MKKILLALTLGFSVVGMAQADLSVTLNSPMNNDVIGPNSPFSPSLTYTNLGTEPIDINDTLFFSMSIDGNTLSVGGGSLFYIDSVSLPANGGTYSVNFPALTLNIPGQAMTTMSFCVDVYAEGAGWTGVTESNTANNQSCATVTYDPNSIGITEYAQAAELNRKAINNSYFANGTFFVRVENASFKSATSLSVYSISGAEVYNVSLSNDGSSINEDVNLSGLNKGIYLVEVKGLANRSVKKIAIQ